MRCHHTPEYRIREVAVSRSGETRMRARAAGGTLA